MCWGRFLPKVRHHLLQKFSAQLDGDVAHRAAVDAPRLRRAAPNATRYGGPHALIRRGRRGKYIASHADRVSGRRCDA